MPKFSITDSQTGRTMTVEGDSAPTEQDAQELFASYDAPRPTPQLSEFHPTLRQRFSGLLHDIRTSEPVEKILGQTPDELAANPPGDVSPTYSTHGVMGLFESKKPLLDVPENPKTATEGLHAWAANVVNSAASPAGMALAPLTIARTTPAIVKKALGIAFGAQGAAMSYEQAKDLVMNGTKNNAAQNVMDVGNILLGGLMTAGGVHSLKGAKPSETPANPQVNLPPTKVEGAPEAPAAPASTEAEAPPSDSDLPIFKQPDMTLEQVNARLAEIDRTRKAGAFSGVAREEARLLKQKEALEASTLGHGDEVEATLPDGTTVRGTVIGADESGNAQILTPDGATHTLPERMVRENANTQQGPVEDVRGQAPGPSQEMAGGEPGQVQEPAGTRGGEEAGLPEQELKDDIDRIRQLQQTIPKLKGDVQQAAFGELESIKAKYGGMIPKLPEEDLTPEAKALLDTHKDAAGGAEIVTDEVLKPEDLREHDPDNPFGPSRPSIIQQNLEEGSPAMADVAGNRIVISRKNLNAWLSGIAPEKRAQAVRSLLSEERIHLATDGTDALNYWNGLSDFEKWATKYKYSGYKYDDNGNPVRDAKGNRVWRMSNTDTGWGYEAVRYRMQQLMRMTPTEIAQEYGGRGAFRRRMSIHAVDALEGIVRKARETVKGSAETKAMFDRIEQNLAIARQAASGAIVQTTDAPYKAQAENEAKQLQAQADHYRKLGITGEADELEQMAQMMRNWSQNEIAPSAAGRKPDPNQGVFDALLSRDKFEQLRAAANLGPGNKFVTGAEKKLFKMAQAESGQQPTLEVPGAAGRGRPKKDRINPWGKENLFAPSAFAAGGDLEMAGGHELPPGQSVKLPTASEVEAGANKFLDKTISESVGNLEAGKQFKVPDFKDFSAFMKRNYKTQPGQVKDLFQRGLVSRLENASGETLSAMLKSVFGRDSILSRMRVPDAEAKEGHLPQASRQLMLDPNVIKDPIGDILQKAKHPGESKGISESEQRQQLRSKAIGMIAKKLMAPMMESDAGIIDRKDISPSEIRFSAGDEGETSSYQELNSADEHNPNLGEMLTDRNRRSNSDKASISRRLTVMQDRKNGQVHMVSTWKNPATGRVFLTNPSLPRGEGLALGEALSRYRLMRSILLDEPVEKFHKSFKSELDYDKKFGDEAKENHTNQSAYNPEDISIQEYEQGVEGSPEVESSSFQGPERKMVEAAQGTGRSSVEESLRSRITKPEADAVSRAIAHAESPEEVRDILKKLGKEDYDKLKFDFHRASARLDKANTALERAKAARLEPSKVSAEDQAERVHNAQQEVLKAQEESLKASQAFRQNAALRSGVAKIARRFQSLYGKKWQDNPVEGVGQRIQVPTSGEEMLGQMSKSLFNAHLTALSGREPVDAIMELGGEQKKSKFDQTVTPTGKDLSMNLPPTSRRYWDRPFSNIAKTQPEQLSPAPPKPIETLDGGQYQEIHNSVMSDERRQEIGNNIVKFTPEEEQEMALEGAINAERHRIYQEESRKEEAARAEAEKNKPFQLEGEKASIKPKDTPLDPRVKIYPPRPVQPKLFAAGRKVTEAVKDQAERLAGLGSAWSKRSDIEKWIASGYDSFLTVAHNLARTIGNEIRTEATTKGVQNKQMLGGAIAMRSANPFRKIFNYSQEALAAFEKAAETHPDVELSNVLLHQDAHGIKLHLQQLIDQTTDQGKKNYYQSLIGDINRATGPDRPVRNEKGQTIRWKGQPETVPPSIRMEGLRIGKEAERQIENKLVEQGLLNHSDAQYKFDPSYKYKLDGFLKQIAIGRAKAMEMLNGAGKLDVFKRRQARAWLKDLDAHQKDVEYAKAHWGDKQLQDTTLKAIKELDSQYDAERDAGTSLSYDDAYLPGRYTGQFHNNKSITFGPVQILGRQFAAGKAFDTPYDATSTGPYISATHDIANLVEHRIRQGAAKVGQRAWENQLSTIKDPVTGQQAFAPSKYINGRWIPDLPVGADAANYESVSANASRAPLYALKGSFSSLLHSLVAPDAITKNTYGRAALQAGQFLKHVSLVGDFFHLNRVTHYAASVMGKGAYNFGRAHTPGWAALDFREEGIDKAVQNGVLTQKDADWLREKLPIKENGFKTTASRLEIAKKFEKAGFNVGQIQDAIYKDLVSHIPGLGSYTKFLFDKYTRGLMMRSAIEEYTRLQAKNPEVESSKLMRGISRDLNNYFGSIGKQGWIRSSTFQSLSRMLFLAPQWVEGIVKKDVAIPYKLGMAAKEGGLGGVVNVLKGNESIARGVTRGLLTMAVLTQVINMITRRQPTWNNEEGHKFDADLGNGVYINPLSVFNEMLHEFIHYNETKPTAWEAVRQIGENKLGFFGRAAMVLATNKGPTGQTQTSSMGALKTAAAQLFPIPITFQTGAQWIGNTLTGGSSVDPVNSQQLMKAAASFAGVKADIAPKLDFAMKQKAMDFVKAKHLAQDVTAPDITDQPSYAKLRHELTIGNMGGANQVLEDLRRNGVKDQDLIAAMKTWVKAPFTGSRRNELLWLHSLSPGELAQYQQAVAMKYDTYKAFVNFYINHAK